MDGSTRRPRRPRPSCTSPFRNLRGGSRFRGLHLANHCRPAHGARRFRCNRRRRWPLRCRRARRCDWSPRCSRCATGNPFRLPPEVLHEVSTALTADDHVVTSLTVEPVLTVAPVELVVASAPTDEVSATAAEDEVADSASDDHVGTRRSDDPVRPVVADDGRPLAETARSSSAPFGREGTTTRVASRSATAAKRHAGEAGRVIVRGYGEQQSVTTSLRRVVDQQEARKRGPAS